MLVGSAEVVIRAITDKLAGDIQKGLNDLEPQFSKSGESAGKSFSEGFNRNFHVDTSGAESDIHRMANDASAAFDDVGRSAEEAISSGAKRGADDAKREASSGGSGAGSNFWSAFNKAGDGGSGGFLSSFALRIAAMVPIIGVLLGAISSLVGGLFALAAAASQALPSLAAIPGVLSAIGQGAGVALIGFSGIGNAIGAGLKTQTTAAQLSAAKLGNTAAQAANQVRNAAWAVQNAEQSSARNILDAQRAVRDSKEKLADTYYTTAKSEQKAVIDVADAERSLENTQFSAKRAQENLTNARIAATRQLRDMQFGVRQDAIDQKQAVIDLQNAKNKLTAVQGLPDNNKTYQEALLAYQQAQLALEETTAKSSDDAQDLNTAQQKGVDGANSVIDAQRALAQSLVDVQKATTDAANAQDALTHLQLENVRAIRDAKEAYGNAKVALENAYVNGPRQIIQAKDALVQATIAQQQANQQFNLGGSEMTAYNEALKKLSPAGQTFVKYLLSMKSTWQGLRNDAQQGIFTGLLTALKTLVSGPLFPVIQKMFVDTGKAIGKFAVILSKTFSSGPFASAFSNVATNNATIIVKLGKVVGHLADAFVQLLDAARPITNMLVDWAVKWSASLDATAKTKNATGELTDKLNSSADVMKQLIGIVKDLAGGIFGLGKAATPAGQTLLDSISSAAAEFNKWANDSANRKKLEDGFNRIAVNVEAIGGLAKDILVALAQLGADPNIGKMAKNLQPVIDKLQTLITTLLDQAGPKITELVSSILDAFNAVAKSGALSLFLDTLTTAIKGVTAALNTPVLGTGLKLLIEFGVAMKAVSIIKKFPGIDALVGGIKWFNTEGKAGTALSGLKGFDKIRFQALLVGESIGKARDKVKLFAGQLIDGTYWAKFTGGAKAAASGVKTAALAVGSFTKSILVNTATAVKNAAIWVWEKTVMVASAIATKAAAAAQWLLTAALDANPIGLIVIAIAALVTGMVIAYKKSETFRNIVNGVFHDILVAAQAVGDFFTKTIPAAFQSVLDWAKKNWPLILGILTGPIGLVVGEIVKHWSDIQAAFSNAWTWISTTFASLWNGLIGIIEAPIQVVSGWLGDFFGPKGPIQGAFNAVWGWISGFFKAEWNGLKAIFTDPVEAAKNVFNNLLGPKSDIRGIFDNIWGWISGFFSAEWAGLKEIFTNPMQAVKNVFNALLGEKGPIRTAFQDAVDAIGKIWSGIQDLAKAPVKFIIDTVWNDGLRKVINLIPGVPTIKEFKPDGFAAGGVLPGWSPGRDIHNFTSPTGGALALSGGEAIMRPEWTQAVGKRTVDFLNGAARKGKSALASAMRIVNGAGTLGDFGVGGKNSAAFAEGGVVGFSDATLKKAVDFANSKVAPGNQYLMGAVGPVNFDCSGFVAAVANVLQDVKNIYTRRGGTGSFPWPGFAPGPGQFTVGSTPNWSGSGIGHMAGTLINSSGVATNVESHADTGPVTGSAARGYTDPHFSQVYHLGAAIKDLANVTQAAGNSGTTNPGDAEKSSWLDVISNVKNGLENVTKGVSTLISEATSNPWAGYAADAAKDSADKVVQWINDKIPDKIAVPGFPDIPLPANPIPPPFDSGGLATGTGWMPKNVLGPERVLSPRQTEAFEQLVQALGNGNAALGGHQTNHIDVTLPHGASPYDVVNGIVYEMKRIQRGGKYAG